MTTRFKPMSWALLLSPGTLLAVTVAVAQTAPPVAPAPAAPSTKSTAQIDAGEPRSDTSPSAVEPRSVAPAATTGTVAGASSTAAAARSTGRARPAAGTTAQKAPAADRLDLGTATVTGDQEQPKVMYIVPWKRSDIGDLSGKPMNSLLDEALAPVDREEFRREVAYYDAVQADAPQNGAKGPASKQGEK